ncbi:hypothetical protein SLEP1_g33555 [Rubroshorea leprosula]|uniref:WAT1-related protein n=1 Tax=Rubroshorea leprosula TaxID=152421 RepID=A0AAV5KGZ4_9ROSI|nr:hypothetical protein SLEP1_g33555 [Rubroshorea leprosula]
MGQIGNFINSLKAPALMTLVQFLNSGINVFYKLAANDGMSLRVIIAYRLMIATVVSTPFALFLEWGSLAQTLYLQSMVYTSATFVSAINNLVTVFTLIIAVFSRLETLKLGMVAGKAKLMGILIGIGGAVMLTLYKGAEINIWSTNINLLHPDQVSAHPGRSHPGTSTFILECSYYPLHRKGLEQMEVGLEYWSPYCSLHGMELASSTLIFFLISWGLRNKGPLYATIFNPLILIFVAIIASLFLDEKLHHSGRNIDHFWAVCGAVREGQRNEMEHSVSIDANNSISGRWIS